MTAKHTRSAEDLAAEVAQTSLAYCLAAANHRLVGANYGLAAAYDRLVGANEAQRRQMQGEMTFASAACGSMRLIKSSLAVRPGDIGRWNDGLLRLLVRS